MPPTSETRSAIAHTLALYAYCVDRRDITGILASFTEQARLHSSTGASLAGRSEIAAFYRAALAAAGAPPLLRHNLTTCHIESDSDHTADACTYFMTVSPHGLDHAGHYRDRFERQGDLWLLAQRQIVVEWFATPSWYQTTRLGRG